MTGVANPMAVWQVAAGPSDRSYAEVFLRFGVALISPGDAGPWSPARDDAEYEGVFVRRFATELHVGDTILLRTGKTRIRAVGLVAGDYQYASQFDDVNGWDLSHARRVRWGALPAEYDFGSAAFGANPPRISQVHNPDVVDYARRFISSPPTDWQSAPLPHLPIEEEELGEVPAVLRHVVAEIRDLVPLFGDSDRFGEPPGEDELIVHFVVPLLKALGWPPERIAVQWRHVDVCVFRALPRLPENIAFLIEAKRLGAGVEGALGQAKGYVSSLGVVCDVVVTDGVRYRMYQGSGEFRSVAYANLLRLKKSAADLFQRLGRP